MYVCMYVLAQGPKLAGKMPRHSVRRKLILIKHLGNLSTHKISKYFKNNNIFCPDKISDQNQNCSDTHHILSENVRCPIVILGLHALGM